MCFCSRCSSTNGFCLLIIRVSTLGKQCFFILWSPIRQSWALLLSFMRTSLKGQSHISKRSWFIRFWFPGFSNINKFHFVLLIQSSLFLLQLALTSDLHKATWSMIYLVLWLSIMSLRLSRRNLFRLWLIAKSTVRRYSIVSILFFSNSPKTVCFIIPNSSTILVIIFFTNKTHTGEEN